MTGAIILGGGVTGLAAGLASGFPVFEASVEPGGICSSYYLRPGDADPGGSYAEAYRFEIGGGHWIFGGDPFVLRLIESMCRTKVYSRRSAVYFAKSSQYVPYPIQNHLRYLSGTLTARCLAELAVSDGHCASTMKEWLTRCFGNTLGNLFFHPFHELYTAGLYDRIAPQDAYKSPIDLNAVAQGAVLDAKPVGYNTHFIYPQAGLDSLARALAAECSVHYGKRAVNIDLNKRIVAFEDGTEIGYSFVISTLPLNKIIGLCGIDLESAEDPYTSVLVLNIGAVKGARCPSHHWLYNPDATAGFHRVGFYSNVDASFLPASTRQRDHLVSMYVERAYLGGTKPTNQEIEEYTSEAISELQSWEYIRDVEVVHPNWIDVAYTWTWAGSKWTLAALRELEAHDIYQVGRYGRWVFQGIADSIRDGLFSGASCTRNRLGIRAHA